MSTRLVALGLFGLLLPRPAPLQAAPPPSVAWREVVSPGEEALLASLPPLVRAVQDANARYFGGAILRTFHPYPVAGARGELRVATDLPPEACHGVLVPGARYPATVRWSRGLGIFRSDKVPDIWGMAVKLTGVPGEGLIEDPEHGVVMDLLALNAPTFPAATAASVPKVLHAAADYVKILWRGPKALRVRDIPAAIKVFGRLALRRFKSLATETYWSGVPIKVGPYAARFQWRPRAASPGKLRRSRDYLGPELAGRLSREPMVYELRLQFFRDEDHTPIENAMKEWDEEHAPWVTVAELVIPRHDAAALEAATAASDRMYFHPWQVPATHRPLGSVMRARKVAYSASQIYRGRPPDHHGTSGLR